MPKINRVYEAFGAKSAPNEAKVCLAMGAVWYIFVYLQV